MASREKRPLAPSKTKQKANSASNPSLSNTDNRSTTSSSSSSTSNSTKKSTVAAAGKAFTSSLSTRNNTQLARDILEAVATGSQLPVKVDASLPRKRALQTALKRKQKAKKTLIKVKQKVPIKTLKRIVEAKKILNKKKKKPVKADNSLDSSIESEETKNKCKTAKKSKTPAKFSSVEGEDKSPKLAKKVAENSPKGAKGGKAATAAQKRNESKERETKAKRSLSKEPEEIKIKTEPVDDYSYELTIEEVIASSMLIEPAAQVEGEESASEGEHKVKRLVRNPLAKRSLRNGKLRQPTPKIEDSDEKKFVTMSDAGVESSLDLKSMNVTDPNDTCIDGSVVVKLENENNENSKPSAANNNHVDEDLDMETNNNASDNPEGDKTEETGPTLRSKTKARTSDSSSDAKSIDGDAKVVEDKSSSTFKNDVDVAKKERALAKFNEIRNSVPSTNTSPKSRRSSLNIDMRRSSMFSGNIEKMTPDGGSKIQIDDMIAQIKLSITKTIESKMFLPDGKGMILGKSFEAPKMEEVVAAINDSAVIPKLDKDLEEENSTTSKKELDTADDNTVPKVADTAKEIEKLVMGDIENTVDPSQSSSDKEEMNAAVDQPPSKVDTIAKGNANVFENDEQQQQQHDEKTSQQSDAASMRVADSEKDCTAKQVEEVKKPSAAAPTRKSMRVTASRSSSVLDVKKALSVSDIANELNKSDDEEKEKVLKSEETSEKEQNENTEIQKVDESSNDNKTVPATEVSLNTAKDINDSASKASTEDEKMEVDEPVEANKSEETLESLSREIEQLVKADNDKATDNDTSDVEMKLMIDEEDGELPQSQNNNDDGCDEKSSAESIEDVQKVANDATVAETTNAVQFDSETVATTALTATTTAASPPPPITTASITAKTVATDEKSKDVVKSTVKPSETTEEVEEQKETRRVLRARSDKHKRVETVKPVPTPATTAQDKSDTKVNKPTDDAATSEVPSKSTQDSKEISDADNQSEASKVGTCESNATVVVIKTEPEEQPEPQIRTRRSREAKKSLPILNTKGKRGGKKQEIKKVETQPPPHNKEETLLDNEVAEINENDRSIAYLKTDENIRRLSANSGSVEHRKLSEAETKSRSKSENDVLSTNLSNDILKAESEARQAANTESKASTAKDSDDTSTSGESSISVDKILETPEDKAKKEDILRHLGLESWEKINERKAKKEQYTGTLKTIIRLQKEKEGKKRSRSPLKMVLKQQGRMEGDDSFDFYTIQKEFGTSGLGDSSSGANRKLPTNPRHSCDEDNDEHGNDRQSLIIPEKSSSFSIHPGRLCADNCCYCHGKFGSLDTPMHLAQMKSNDRRRRILENEVHLTKDSCLCDACYRHVDRKSNMSPTNIQLKPERQNRQPIMECMAKDCHESAKHHVKRRWLHRIKPTLKDIDIKWDVNQHSLMMFCQVHYAKIEEFLACTLCKRRLVRNSSMPLGLSDSQTEELNHRFNVLGIPAAMQPNAFVCKLCKYFVKLHLKHVDFNCMSDSNKDFYKKYRKKLLYCHDIDVPNSEEELEESSNQQSKNKDKNRSSSAGTNTSNKKPKCSLPDAKQTSKSPSNLETHSATTSEKSSPEPPKMDSETPIVKESISISTASHTQTSSDSRFLGLEGAIEKLKKRKALDTTISPRSILNTSQEMAKNSNSSRGVVEILAMDKEVTLTRLPKRPRLANDTTSASNDITPVVQRLGANPSISVRTLFPGEEEMNLHANIEFNNVRITTPLGWEKCATLIQYDRDTKILWQELQRPYGNQSSFLRHLVLLEKYYRAGDLILAPNASRNAINYSTSVQNRLISYEGPEKVDEPPMLELSSAVDYNNSHRLSGGYILENRDRPSAPSTSTTNSSILSVTSQLSKMEPSTRVMKLTPGVSIIKKPPPNLQRLNPSNTGVNGSAKRKESIPVQKSSTVNTVGGKVFQLTETGFKRFQNLKKQKQTMNDKNATFNANTGSGSSNSSPTHRVPTAAQYLKAQQIIAPSHSQFQKHLRMQQEMYSQRSRGAFEPICDTRSLANENTPSQNLISNLNLNLPKSIQVTTKPPMASSTPIPILPKIPKSLTVIPQTVVRTQDK